MRSLDYKKVFNILVEETKKYLLDNNLKAMILGISGGIDSTVTATICHEVSKQTGIPLIGANYYVEVDTILKDFLAYNEIFSTNDKKLNVDSYLKCNTLIHLNQKMVKKVLNRHLASEFKRKNLPIYIERKNYEIVLFIFITNVLSNEL